MGLILTISTVSSQSVENLTADQKKEYNRRKLTVEKVSETSGGMGWYWGFFSKRINTWRAFRGLANQIEGEEFFRLTGYDDEADKVRKNLEDANSMIYGGAILYVGGLIFSLIPKTETITEPGFFSDFTYEEVSYPYLVPGTIAWLVGIYLWYKGIFMKLKPVAPYQTASDIADEYNKMIIAELTK